VSTGSWCDRRPIGARNHSDLGTVRCDSAGLFRAVASLGTIDAVTTPDPADELRRLYPPILTTAHVAEMMHCTIGDVRDKVHRGELEALRWGQQFRFFREEVIASMTRFRPGDPTPDDENVRVDTDRN
jgi:excisionase family DNA binding protein